MVTDASNASYVQAEGLTKIYPTEEGDLIALQDVNIDIKSRELFSIVGPSGCGKSTFLRCVAGLTSFSEGSLKVQGALVSGPPEGMGIVFQRDVLLDWRTNMGNVLLPIEFRGLSVKKYRDKARQLFEMLGLAGFEDRRPWELSGGMRQRVAICRALIQDPDFLLMDEPFGALDAMTRDEMNLELQRVWMANEKTVLFITHSITEAVFLSDRVAIMSQSPGRVIKIVDVDLPRPRPLEIRETPQFGKYVAEIRSEFSAMGMFRG